MSLQDILSVVTPGSPEEGLAGTRLTIETKVDRPMGKSITVKRVYERDDDARK